MKRDFRFLIKLFTATFNLSAFTFGGGYVIVPLMRKKFVEQLHWIEEQEMLDMIAIAQSSPGPIAVNTSIIMGYRLAGIAGALITVLGTVLPPFLIVSLIAFGYTAVRDNRIVALVLKGMQVGVAAMLTSVVYGMVKDIIKQKRFQPLFIMIAVFVAAAFLKVNVAIIILVCAVIGLVEMVIQNKKAVQKEGEVR